MKKLLLLTLPLLFLYGCTWTINTGDVDSGSGITTISLSQDQKTILIDGVIGLSIDNDSIFNFFTEESQLCDEGNILSNPDRKAFCEDKETFQAMTRFASIVVSPDKMKVGITIESETLTPDTVLGIFYPLRTVDQVQLLTNYYLGNSFISFSPTSKNFVYQGDCFEALCALFVKDAETLIAKIDLNHPEFADERTEDIAFVRWINDNEIEYKLGGVIQQISF